MTPGYRQTEKGRQTQSIGWIRPTTSSITDVVDHCSLSFLYLTVLKYSMPDVKKACATSLVVTTHDMGWPLPMGFPMVTMSGTKSSPCSWKAQTWEPTRPKPTWTSSAMTMPPALRTCLQRWVHGFTVASHLFFQWVIHQHKYNFVSNYDKYVTKCKVEINEFLASSIVGFGFGVQIYHAVTVCQCGLPVLSACIPPRGVTFVVGSTLKAVFIVRTGNGKRVCSQKNITYITNCFLACNTDLLTLSKKSAFAQFVYLWFCFYTGWQCLSLSLYLLFI